MPSLSFRAFAVLSLLHDQRRKWPSQWFSGDEDAINGAANRGGDDFVKDWIDSRFDVSG